MSTYRTSSEARWPTVAALLLVLSLIIGPVVAAPGAAGQAVSAEMVGEGTEQNPSVIANLTHFQMMEQDLDTYYVVQSSTTWSPLSLHAITFTQDVTHELRGPRVGVGLTMADPASAGLTAINGDDESVVDNGVLKVSVELRDRFDTPVANKSVNLSIVGAYNGTFLSTGRPRTTVTTGTDGRATVIYQPPNVQTSREVDIRASSDVAPPTGPSEAFNLSTRNNTKIDVRVIDPGGPIGNPPAVPPDRFTSTDESRTGFVVFGIPIFSGETVYKVNWTVKDSPADGPNSNLDMVEVRLIEVKKGANPIVDSIKYEASGETATAETWLRAPRGRDGEYIVKLRYTDEGGYLREVACQSDKADGDSTPRDCR